MLRQNPANTCQLQQSVDNGQTWTLAFDYSLCIQPASQYLLQQEFIRQLQQWYDVTIPTEINPDAPTDTFSGNNGQSPEEAAIRLDALCAAVTLYINLYCETILEINKNAGTALNLTAAALAAVSALGTAGILFTFGTSSLVAIAAGAALAQLGSVAYSGLTDAVLNDTIARRELICCMLDALTGAELIDDNLKTSVDGCTGLGSNAELIRATLAVDLSNDAGIRNQFTAFVNALGEAKKTISAGVAFDCPCDDELPNISLQDTYPGTINNSPVFLYNTAEGGSVWECTFDFVAGQWAVSQSIYVGGTNVYALLIGAYPSVNYQHHTSAGYVSGAGAGVSGSAYNELGFYGSGAGVCTIQIQPA